MFYDKQTIMVMLNIVNSLLLQDPNESPMSLEERIDLTMFNECVAEDDNFEIFEDLGPVPSPTSSTTYSPVRKEFVTLEGDAHQFQLPPKRAPMTREEKRKNNNLASQKSRAKKKEKFQTMEQRVAELEKQNRELKQKLQSVHNKIAILRYGWTNAPTDTLDSICSAVQTLHVVTKSTVEIWWKSSIYCNAFEGNSRLRKL